MELILATPVTIPGPTVHTYRLVATHYDYAANSISIAYARLDASDGVIDTGSDQLTPDQVTTFMATVAVAGQTMQQLFVAASIAYIASVYGAVRVASP